MKLRNKKTGTIGRLHISDDSYLITEDNEANRLLTEYLSLSSLSKEWEDYEEPKEYWYINLDGEIMFDNVEDDTVKAMREIGNYFKTKEGAEKAVEKLKAWKRLKEAGYCFTPDTIEEGLKHFYILRLGCEKEKIMKSVSECRSNYKDLKILFGGKE